MTARINMDGTYTRAELLAIIADNDPRKQYIWSDGAYDWDLSDLVNELEKDADKVTLFLAGYDDEAQQTFANTFAAEMARLVPAYDFDADCQASSPWCAPWTWETPYEYVLTGDGAEADAKAFAEKYASQISEECEE